MTQKGLPDEFRAAGEWIRAMPEPSFVVVGNHDVPYYSALDRLFWPWRAFEAATGHPAHDGQFRSDTLMVRGVTTARGWQARLPRALRILACHHPLIEMIGTPMTGDVKRGERAAVIFAEAGVDLIMTGHTHIPFALPIDLSDRCSYAVGCGTLSHRERGAPPSFNEVVWTPHEIVVTVIQWTGSVLERGQTWRLPRRQDTRHAETAPDPQAAGVLETAAT